jgi:multidrug efflux pump subunit AcrA (membrane-fusion protein)
MSTASHERVSISGRTPRKWIRGLGTVLLAVILTAGIVFLMLSLAGFFQPKVSSARLETVKERIPNQPTGEVWLIRRPRLEPAVGSVRAVQEVAVASKLLARVKEVRVKAGQPVQQGEVVLLLDDADLKARLHQAQAAETAAGAKLEQARIDYERGKRLQAK